ncbi:MAG: PGPGW domain-containing protein [Phycisphaerales bacterium]|nr:PGPGW domain-containing protein [Phycisphaerales bacterium]
MISWIKAHSTLLLSGLGILSVVTFVGSLIALPILVARLPEDYFITNAAPARPWRTEHPVRGTVVYLGRNLLGLVLVAGGIAMLFLPGQGLLAIAIGLLMMDLPRKRRLQAWLVSLKPIHKGITWLRRKAGQPAFRFDPTGSGQSA